MDEIINRKRKEMVTLGHQGQQCLNGDIDVLLLKCQEEMER